MEISVGMEKTNSSYRKSQSFYEPEDAFDLGSTGCCRVVVGSLPTTVNPRQELRVKNVR
jgi:hypothetical protein